MNAIKLLLGLGAVVIGLYLLKVFISHNKISILYAKIASLGWRTWAFVTIFLVGIVTTLALSYWADFQLGNPTMLFVLWFTGIAIWAYTVETSILKRIQAQHLTLEKSPVLIVHFRRPKDDEPDHKYSFLLRNVGRGLAKRVTWEIPGGNVRKTTALANISKPSGEITWQEAILELMKQSPELSNHTSPFPNKTVITPGGHTRIESKHYHLLDPRHGQHYEVVIHYEDIDGNKYRTNLVPRAEEDDYEITYYGAD